MTKDNARAAEEIVVEQSFRAGFAAAEQALGAHGSDRLLAAVESAWAEYQLDHPAPQPTSTEIDTVDGVTREVLADIIRPEIVNKDSAYRIADKIMAVLAPVEEWEGDLTAEERAMIDGAWEKHKDAGPCDRAPTGWACRRNYGHDGPCAALRTDTQTKEGERAIIQKWRDNAFEAAASIVKKYVEVGGAAKAAYAVQDILALHSDPIKGRDAIGGYEIGQTPFESAAPQSTAEFCPSQGEGIAECPFCTGPVPDSPLQKLGAYLADLLHEDQWATAERYLNAALRESQSKGDR